MHQMNSAEQFSIKNHLDEAHDLFAHNSHMMPKAPSTNRIFAPIQDQEPTEEKYVQIASKINQEAMESS